MNIHRFRALHAAGATFVEIGRECGCDWRTVRKYLAEDAPTAYFSRESAEALPHLTYQVSASRSSYGTQQGRDSRAWRRAFTCDSVHKVQLRATTCVRSL
jgi:hypothetical protein